MLFKYVYFVLGVLVGALVGALGTRALRQFESYDECMLNAMKGQPSHMYASAYAACRARHPNG
jgi:hypothetical protein